MSNKKDYKVGYKKPPAETQWKKGQSGNPGGRPPKSETSAILHGEELNRVLLRVANLPLSVRSNGKEEMLPAITAILKRLMTEAANGTPWAMKYFLKAVYEAYAKESEVQKRLLELQFEFEDNMLKKTKEMGPLDIEEQRHRRWKMFREMRTRHDISELPYEKDEPRTALAWKLYEIALERYQNGLTDVMEWPAKKKREEGGNKK
jgi:hypothetical protein